MALISNGNRTEWSTIRSVIIRVINDDDDDDDDDDGSENVAKKRTCVLSNSIASIWTRSICQMQATFPGVEFLRISVLQVQKEERKFVVLCPHPP